MADDKKVIEINLKESATSTSSSSSAASKSSTEDRELQKLKEMWRREEERDRKQLEDSWIDSQKKFINAQIQAEETAKTSLTSFDELMREILDKAQQRYEEDKQIYGGEGIPDMDLLSSEGLPKELDEATTKLTDELDTLTSGTKQASTYLGRFAQALSQAAQTAANALAGGVGASPPFGGGGGGVAAGGLGGVSGGGGLGGLGGLASAAIAGGEALALVAAAGAAFNAAVNAMTDAVGGMSAEVATAQARSQVQQIEDQLRLAREAGPEIAELEGIRSDMVSEFRGIFREGIETFGPILEVIGEAIEKAARGIKTIIELIGYAFEAVEGAWNFVLRLLERLPVVGRVLLKLEEWLKDQKKDASDDLQHQVDSIFFGNQLEMDRLDRNRSNRGANAPDFI